MKKVLMGVLLAGAIISSIFMAGACSSPKVGNSEQQSKEASESAKAAYEMSMGETGGRDDKVPDPTAPKVERVSIYIPGPGGITQSMDSIDTLDAGLLFAKFAELNVTDQKAQLESFDITGDKGVLSLSGVDINNKQLMAAIANTYIDNFELANITIEVDGQSISDTTDMKFETDINKSGNVKINTVTTLNGSESSGESQ
jgi:hypothetical protein